MVWSVGREKSADRTTDRWTSTVLAAAVVAAVLFRVVRLQVLPGEMYGDITIVFEYVDNVRNGRWPTNFVLSSGPLYHYLIVPIVWVTHLDFEGLKIASVVTSLAVLGVTYAYVRELVDRELAVLSLFIAGVSSWLLVFSRLGNSQIVTPLLSMGALYFVVRVARRGQWWNAAACGVIAAAGLYEYPQTFVLVPVMAVCLALLVWTGAGVRWRDLEIFGIAASAAAIPFVFIVRRNPGNFLDGYIGGKIQSSSGTWSTLAGNARRTLLAFNLHGDIVFRGNPRGVAHLDTLSGLLFLVGIVYWLMPDRRRWAPAVLVPFFLLLVPSMLVLSNPAEVPSASRTLAAAPLAYVLVASGLWWSVSLMRGVTWMPQAMTALLLMTIMVSNGHRYFVTYADGLPNHNVPFGRIIADYLHDLPDDTQAYTIGCCWGQAGQPEPKGIRDLGAGPVADGLIEVSLDSFDCAALAQVVRPAVLIWRPDVDVPPGLQSCADQLRPQLHSSGGFDVFWSSEL
ncbi:MAG: conserved rane protein of unknown function [Ilumatobacteraceae bacterium]|nr:conserved rane protein of unknown function [Ilumatobacteraceae bacterium]